MLHGLGHDHDSCQHLGLFFINQQPTLPHLLDNSSLLGYQTFLAASSKMAQKYISLKSSGDFPKSALHNDNNNSSTSTSQLKGWTPPTNIGTPADGNSINHQFLHHISHWKVQLSPLTTIGERTLSKYQTHHVLLFSYPGQTEDCFSVFDSTFP